MTGTTGNWPVEEINVNAKKKEKRGKGLQFYRPVPWGEGGSLRCGDFNPCYNLNIKWGGEGTELMIPGCKGVEQG